MKPPARKPRGHAAAAKPKAASAGGGRWWRWFGGFKSFVESGAMGGLSPGAAKVYCSIIKHTDPDTWQARPGITRIAREAGIVRSTACEALRELEAAGLLRRTRAKGGSPTCTTVYHLAQPVRWSGLVSPTGLVRPTGRNQSGGAYSTSPVDRTRSYTLELRPKNSSSAGARARTEAAPPPAPSAAAAEGAPESRKEPAREQAGAGAAGGAIEALLLDAGIGQPVLDDLGRGFAGLDERPTVDAIGAVVRTWRRRGDAVGTGALIGNLRALIRDLHLKAGKAQGERRGEQKLAELSDSDRAALVKRTASAFPNLKGRPADDPVFQSAMRKQLERELEQARTPERAAPEATP